VELRKRRVAVARPPWVWRVRVVSWPVAVKSGGERVSCFCFVWCGDGWGLVLVGKGCVFWGVGGWMRQVCASTYGRGKAGRRPSERCNPMHRGMWA
jgi:hypothetical protein